MSASAQSNMPVFYVYALFRDTGEPFYIGKGQRDRWASHERQARAGTQNRKCAIIRKIWDRGVDLIKIKIHEGLTHDVAHKYEAALIAAIGRHPDGPLANLTDGGEGCAGMKMTLEQIAKRSAANRGKRRSIEQCAKISAAMRGMKQSPEHIENAAMTRRGKKRSPETCAKMRGKKRSAETCAKISEGNRGKRHSAESLAKISVAAMGNKRCVGRHVSPETRARISTALVGKKLSAVTIAKRAATRHATRKRLNAESPMNEG